MLRYYWQVMREKTWLVTDYCLMDTVFIGADYSPLKKQIAEAHGYEEFADMALSSTDLLVPLLEDLPADGDEDEPVVWDILAELCSTRSPFSMQRPSPGQLQGSDRLGSLCSASGLSPAPFCSANRLRRSEPRLPAGMGDRFPAQRRVAAQREHPGRLSLVL